MPLKVTGWFRWFYRQSQTIKNNMTPDPKLTNFIENSALAPFAPNMLEVDEALWGGFWQGDVIGPGYCLPAAELALLRAVRLDGYWPTKTTLSQFLADLRTVCHHPQAGVWTLTVAGQPCAVLAAPVAQMLTVVWYCVSTGELHAGYRTAAIHFPGAVVQRAPKFGGLPPLPPPTVPGWLSNLDASDSGSVAARLDRAILRMRGLARD